MVSIKALVMGVTLLTLCLLTTNTSAVHPGCCRSYMKTKLPFLQIKGYAVQSDQEMCPINAIIFLTKKGKLFCADPALNWVMDSINRLRAKAQIVHKNSLSKK
ncbi:C-C motif chemokine 20a.3 [Notolabrus celidotus]|uniref:C-C motif chemokine 20a.3 n=1 Tax=Notolabrus celidotus TaxID=1203425 RepID=UPI00148FFC10|nr:C-C motif chemokine 20a.3 [Notolabrus celidotus]